MTPNARRLYDDLRKTLVPVLADDPAVHPDAVTRAVRLRTALLGALRLPVTRHNITRLVRAAAGGWPLRAYMRDVDRSLPNAVLADGDLFLSAIAMHAASRRLVSAHDRCYDAEAFLHLPHDGHSSSVVMAFLAGALSWAHLIQRIAKRSRAPMLSGAA